MIEVQKTTDAGSLLARRLLQTFGQFHRLHWRDSPIPGLSPGEAMLVFEIMRACTLAGQGVKVSELSTLMQVSTPTITQQINNLVARGLVQKAAGEDDRRVVRVTLTETGQRLARNAFAEFITAFQGLVDYLGVEDSEKLVELLTRMFEYFERRREQAAGQPPDWTAIREG